jgi:hypothetical protein
MAAPVPAAGQHTHNNRHLLAGAICARILVIYWFGKNIMKLPHRRRFLHLAAGAAALPGRVPDRDDAILRPDRLIVGYAADTNTTMYGEIR